MFNSTVLDTAIALIFIYTIFSLLASTIKEWIAGWLHWRGVMLKRGVGCMIAAAPNSFIIRTDSTGAPLSVQRGDKLNVDVFFKTPGINSQSDKDRLPSYIAPDQFANAYLALAFPGNDGTTLTLNRLRQALEIAEVSVAADLRTFISLVTLPSSNLNLGVQNWFNANMDRVSGWYKRKTQFVLVLISIVLVAGLNIDTIRITKEISKNSTMRNAIVAAATKTGSDSTKFFKSNIHDIDSTVSTLGIPLGWNRCYCNAEDIISLIFGLMLTAAALSLGAPFWFDLLNKFTNLRYSGPKPDENKK